MLSDSDIQKSLAGMGLAPARVYDPSVLAQAVAGLQQEYISRSKNNVKIDQKITPLERNRIAIELTIDEGQTTVIRNINFSGNEHYSDRTLRNQISMSEKGMMTWLTRDDRFSPEKFSTDLQKLTAFYQDHGYLDFKVTSTNVSPNDKYPEDLDLSIGVSEGQRYRWGTVTVAGDTREVPTEELQKLAKIKTGAWYNHSRMGEIVQSLKDRMGESGYADADIDIRPQPEGEQVNFVLNVVPNNKIYINEIRISGNNKTRDEVIRRELRQMESAAYDYAKIERSKVRIQQLGYFDDVQILRSPVPDKPDQVNLDVIVKEVPTGSMELSVGYVQDDGMVLSAGISQDNLFGSGKSLSARVSNGGSSKVASMSFTDPYLTADGVSLGYDVFWRTYDPNKADITAYKTNSYGAGIRMGVPITEYDRVNFGLGANNMRISLYPQSPQRYRDFVQKFGQSNWTATGNISWGRNTTDSAFWPTRGYIIDVGMDAGLPGGDIQYYKFTHNQSWFFPLSKSLTLMLNGGVGYAKGYNKTRELPFFHNFYGGGLGSVRGYENGSVGPKGYDGQGGLDYLGGTKRANFSAEILFPMPGVKDARTVRMSLFADAGSVWDGKTYTQADFKHYGARHVSSFKNELRYSGGVALTWLSPLGPMKFSYAYPIHKKEGDQVQRFQFQLGTVF